MICQEPKEGHAPLGQKNVSSPTFGLLAHLLVSFVFFQAPFISSLIHRSLSEYPCFHRRFLFVVNVQALTLKHSAMKEPSPELGGLRVGVPECELAVQRPEHCAQMIQCPARKPSFLPSRGLQCNMKEKSLVRYRPSLL